MLSFVQMLHDEFSVFKLNIVYQKAKRGAGCRILSNTGRVSRGGTGRTRREPIPFDVKVIHLWLHEEVFHEDQPLLFYH